jgi:hypothetical protein
MRKEADPMQEGRITKDPGIQGVLVGLIDHITHLFIQQGRHIYLKNHKVAQKYLLSGIKGEGMNWNHLQGELRKLKPPNFDGENKKGEEVEAWLLEIRKYFQLHNYSSNLEARVSIYHLQGKILCGGIN